MGLENCPLSWRGFLVWTQRLDTQLAWSCRREATIVCRSRVFLPLPDLPWYCVTLGPRSRSFRWMSAFWRYSWKLVENVNSLKSDWCVLCICRNMLSCLGKDMAQIEHGSWLTMICTKVLLRTSFAKGEWGRVWERGGARWGRVGRVGSKERG